MNTLQPKNFTFRVHVHTYAFYSGEITVRALDEETARIFARAEAAKRICTSTYCVDVKELVRVD
jgi:hypothetical protein